MRNAVRQLVPCAMPAYSFALNARGNAITVWRWTSFAQAPAARLPLLSFIVIVGMLLFIALFAVAPGDPPRPGKHQPDVQSLGETSVFGRHAPKR